MDNLFSALESPLLSPNLKNSKETKHLSLQDFEKYLIKRLQENIAPQLLLNIMKNVVCYSNFAELDIAFNNFIVTNYLGSYKYKEYVYYLLKYDRRPINSICATLMWHLQFRNRSEALEEIKTLSKESNIEYFYLVMKLMEAYQEAPNIKNALLIDDLDVDSRYQLLLNSVRFISYPAFYALVSNMNDYDFSLYLKRKLYDEGDSNLFLRLLCDSKVSLEVNPPQTDISNLCAIFLEVKDKIPNTIKTLFEKAKTKEYLNFLLNFSDLFSKKDVLKVLLASNEQHLIDTFYRKHKEDSTIKGLLPFI
jgi:hypothetical protein